MRAGGTNSTDGCLCEILTRMSEQCFQRFGSATFSNEHLRVFFVPQDKTLANIFPLFIVIRGFDALSSLFNPSSSVHLFCKHVIGGRQTFRGKRKIRRKKNETKENNSRFRNIASRAEKLWDLFWKALLESPPPPPPILFHFHFIFF